MKVTNRLVGFGATVACIGAGAIALAPLASADAPTQTISRTVTATCNFPVVNNQTVTIDASGTAPTSVVAGSVVTVTNLSGVIHMPDAVTSALVSLFKAKSAVGANDANGVPLTTLSAVIDDNGTKVPRTIPIPVATQQVPQSGTNWTIPVPVADQTYTTTTPGTVSVSLGDTVNVSVHVYDANGKAITSIGGDPVTFPCTIDAGQNLELGSVTVTKAVSTVASTTTTVTASPASGANVGDSVKFSAAVSTSDSSAVAGSVEFFDGTTSLGKVAAAGASPVTVSTTTSALTAGTHPITAVYTPTDSTKQSSSTSAAVSYVVGSGTVTPPTGGTSGSEGLTVTVPSASQTGSLTLSIPSNGPVVFTTPAIANDPTNLVATATMNPVTVLDTRAPSNPGWTASGQVSDFTSGANTIPGSGLGWAPSVTSSTAGQTVTPGAAVTSGLKAGATLATAPTGKGAGTAVLAAGLTLNVPVATAAATYTATLTLTVV